MDGVWNANNVEGNGETVLKYRGREYRANTGETVGQLVSRVVREEGITGTFNVIGDGTVIPKEDASRAASDFKEILIVEKISGA